MYNCQPNKPNYTYLHIDKAVYDTYAFIKQISQPSQIQFITNSTCKLATTSSHKWNWKPASITKNIIYNYISYYHAPDQKYALHVQLLVVASSYPVFSDICCLSNARLMSVVKVCKVLMFVLWDSYVPLLMEMIDSLLRPVNTVMLGISAGVF